MNEKFNILKEEELKAMSLEELKAEKLQAVKEGQRLAAANQVDEGKQLVEYGKLVQSIIDTKKEEPKTVAKKDIQTEERSYLTQIDDVLTRGVTTADIPVIAGQGKLKIKDTFDIGLHVTNEETSKVTGNLPTLNTDESMANVDELMVNPDLNKLKVSPEENKYTMDTFRGQLGLSFEMYDDALDTPAYIDGIGQSVIRNTKLKQLVSKATPTAIADKPVLITAINAFDMGALKLVANKQNLNAVGAMADQIIYDDGKVLYRLGGVLIEAVEAPKTMKEALLFNQDSTHILTRCVNYRLAEPAAGQLFFAKLLKITLEMGIVLEEPVLNLTF